MTHQDQTEAARDAASSFAPATSPEGATQATPSTSPATPDWTRRSLGILLAGALVIGGVAGGTVTLTSGPQRAEVDQVMPADIDAATPSFPRTERGSQIDDARACRIPLAFVTLVPRDGSTGLVRIRSGAYWTPVIHLGTAPIRVGLPYPAPYPTGIGDFDVESTGAAFNMYLRPGWISGPVNGTATVHVWWHVKAPC